MFAVRTLYGVLILGGAAAVTWAALFGLYLLHTILGDNLLAIALASPGLVFMAYLVGEGGVQFSRERNRYKVK